MVGKSENSVENCLYRPNPSVTRSRCIRAFKSPQRPAGRTDRSSARVCVCVPAACSPAVRRPRGTYARDNNNYYNTLCTSIPQFVFYVCVYISFFLLRLLWEKLILSYFDSVLFVKMFFVFLLHLIQRQLITCGGACVWKGRHINKIIACKKR